MASTEALSEKAEPFDAWPDIIAVMKNYSHSVAAAFNGSSAYVNGEYMLIEAPQIAFDLLKRASQRDKMREAIQQVTGCVYKLGPYKPPAEAVGGSQKPQNALDSFIRDIGRQASKSKKNKSETRVLYDESTFTAGYGGRRRREFAAACPSGTEDAGEDGGNHSRAGG